MDKIDPTKLPKEITDKYSIVSNAFRLDEIKNAELDKIGEPKDEINIEVGDTKQADFLPQVKMMRWTNEVNFSVRLKDEDTVNTATISTDKNKIIWDKGNIKIENYSFDENEGGYKFVWYLKAKPLTNKVEFTIQSKGLDFLYQTEPTQQEKDEGVSMPENVIGSYAVYHSTKGRMNDINGKEYKVGKAFHIYRPHIIDANGAETWGVLNIENGIYSVEIPQKFIDTAVYPIKSNDTFGYTSAGASATALNSSASDRLIGSGYSISEDGTVTKLTTYFTVWDVGGVAKAGLWNNSRVLLSDTEELSTTATGWRDLNLSSSQAITTASYRLAAYGKNGTPIVQVARDDDAGVSRVFVTSGFTYPTAPDPIPDWTTTGKLSIYGTYTPNEVADTSAFFQLF